MSAPTTDEVLDRLEILWRKLEDEGFYVSGNTAWLAIEEIKRLRDEAEVVRVSDGRLARRTYNPRKGKWGWTIYSADMVRELWLTDRQMKDAKL